ncbi:hypothetical protein QAD02_022273 [Eretmocerus hayati]|uniref:Uncharacterized protein n=1 Tax=Eretmocerus hayati TaxID=131215 RepID=A0ACC2PV10_9HYME|nr:hypothetical protein QAD02_022273 [Eretmocerus hayati]
MVDHSSQTSLRNDSPAPMCYCSAMPAPSYTDTSTTLVPGNPTGGPHFNLLQDIARLLHNSKHSDIVLLTQDSPNGSGFHVHKAIISARSTVFAQLCDQSGQNIVLKDISYDVLKKVLEFIYKGSISNFQGHHCDIFCAAEKYGLPDLKDMSLKSMKGNLTVENATKVLVIAHNHESRELKEIASQFISQNALEVIKTSGYIELSERYPNLITELYNHLVTQAEN